MTTSFSRMWSEEEYLALPETKEKIELFDGCLVEQAAPTYGHQDLAVELSAALRPAARAACREGGCQARPDPPPDRVRGDRHRPRHVGGGD
jgi:Uma2 family endonuclease